MLTTQISQNTKQVIILNNSAKLTQKKKAVQIAQASLGAFFEAGKDEKKAWLKEGRPQLVLNVFNEEDLQDLLTKAEKQKLPICWVEDKTRKATAKNRLICLGIGPVTEAELGPLLDVVDYYRWIRESALSTRTQEN